MFNSGYSWSTWGGPETAEGWRAAQDTNLQSFYYDPESLKATEQAIEKYPNLEIGFNTYSNLQEYTEALDFGIYTYHTRGEILNDKGFECLEKLERNSTVYAAATNFKLSVIEPKVVVRAADKSYKAGLLKEFVEYVLAEMDGTITDACYDILSAILPGYSITEKVYKTVMWKGQPKKVLRALKNKKAGLYSFYLDAFDNIKAVRSLVHGDQPLPKEKFVLYAFLRKHGNPYGFPLFDVLYPLWFAINELQKFMLIGAAKFANPSLVMYMPNGASEAVVGAAQDFANRVGTSTVGSLPESVKAEILDITNKSRNPYLDLLRYFISEVEKVLLHNDLTISQSNKYGTRAESSVKAEQGKGPLVRYARRQLEDALKEQLVRPLLQYNFDPKEYPVSIYPSLYFNDEERKDRQSFVNMVTMLTDKGYLSPERDGDWVRDIACDEAPKAGDDRIFIPDPDNRTPQERFDDEMSIQEQVNYEESFDWSEFDSEYEVEYAEEKETNFPKKGDNKKVSLNNSNFKQFDFAFANKIKKEYPDIFRLGGNIYGGVAFNNWKKLREGNRSKSVLDWLYKREAWAARHKNNHRIEGVIALMKWGVVGSKGEAYMKKLIKEEIKKRSK